MYPSRPRCEFGQVTPGLELARTVPSTVVLRDIANQARHLYAVSARLVAASVTAGHLPEHAAQAVHVDLREAARS